jgi:cytoskeletal protein RodZ
MKRVFIFAKVLLHIKFFIDFRISTISSEEDQDGEESRSPQKQSKKSKRGNSNVVFPSLPVPPSFEKAAAATVTTATMAQNSQANGTTSLAEGSTATPSFEKAAAATVTTATVAQNSQANGTTSSAEGPTATTANKRLLAKTCMLIYN